MLLFKATPWCQFYKTALFLFVVGLFVIQVHSVQIFDSLQFDGDDADDRGDDGDDSASEGSGDSATA